MNQTLYGDSLIPGWPEELDAPWGPYRARVVGHHDGDTVYIEFLPYPNRREEAKVRMYGCNAPELIKPEGKESAAYLASLAPIGSKLLYIPLINRAGQVVTSFDRVIGTIEAIRAPGVVEDLAHTMVRAGHAYFCDADLRPLDGPPPPIRRWLAPTEAPR